MHVGRARRGPRVGIIVPRFKHSAVARNLVKRRLRELARLQILPTGLLVDIVVRIRPEAYEASFEDLAVDVRRLVVQLHRWLEPAEVVVADRAVELPQAGDTT